jgi:hypothetical protein
VFKKKNQLSDESKTVSKDEYKYFIQVITPLRLRKYFLSKECRRAQNYATQYLKFGFDDFNLTQFQKACIQLSVHYTNTVVQDEVVYYFLFPNKKRNKEMNVKV